MRKEDTVIVTHGDCDGICSAAIALMKYRNARILFSQPYYISQTLKHKYVTKSNNIIILDVALNKQSIDILLQYDKNITVIDHHKISERATNLFDGIIDTRFSTSYLTSVYYSIPTKLAIIGMIGDKEIYVSKGEQLFNQSELIHESISYDVNDNKFKRELIKQLSLGKLPSEIPECEKRAKKSKLNKVIIESECNKHAHIHENFVFIDARKLNIEGYASSIAGSLAIQYKKPIFILFRTSKNKYVITSRKHNSSQLDLSKVLKYFGGGGHNSAASCTITNKDILYNIEQRLDKIIRQCHDK